MFQEFHFQQTLLLQLLSALFCTPQLPDMRLERILNCFTSTFLLLGSRCRNDLLVIGLVLLHVALSTMDVSQLQH
jgi:hypothetical protein